MFVVKREEKPKNMIIGISGFGFLFKNGRFVTVICSSRRFAETPIFIALLCARSLAKLSKREILDPPKKQEILTEN